MARKEWLISNEIWVLLGSSPSFLRVLLEISPSGLEFGESSIFPLSFHFYPCPLATPHLPFCSALYVYNFNKELWYSSLHTLWPQGQEMTTCGWDMKIIYRWNYRFENKIVSQIVCGVELVDWTMKYRIFNVLSKMLKKSK